MNDVYEAAQRRLDELRTEMKMLSDYIELHRKLRNELGLDSPVRNENAVVHSAFTAEAPQGTISDSAENTQATKRSRVTDNPKPADVVAAARRIIIAWGAPLSRRELHQRLANEGLEVRGADPIKALGTMLWRGGDALVQLKGHGYWPKDVPLRDVGYDPDPVFDEADHEPPEPELEREHDMWEVEADHLD